MQQSSLLSSLCIVLCRSTACHAPKHDRLSVSLQLFFSSSWLVFVQEEHVLAFGVHTVGTSELEGRPVR
jgi:hypothetical protein